MTAVAHECDGLPLDPEALAALQRFDADAEALCVASSLEGAGPPCTVHVRATAAYRKALAAGAGLPDDRSWQIFICTVAALVAPPVIDTAHPGMAAAAARLRGILAENADLLPADSAKEFLA